MLRSVTLGLAFAVLAAACALVEPPPPPPGSVRVEARIRNLTAHPVELTVLTDAPARVVSGAVQPSTLESLTTTDVTFYAPPSGRWTLAADGESVFVKGGYESGDFPDCKLAIDLRADGGIDGNGCVSDP